MIKEWNVLRVFASFSIVLLHAGTVNAVWNQELENEGYHFLRVLLSGATAMFILLSFIIMGHIYKEKIPRGFFVKRIKFILIPYISASIIFALYRKFTMAVPRPFFEVWKPIVLGDFIGWFILPIFQLYILFWLIKKLKCSVFSVSLLTIPFGVFFMLKIDHGFNYFDNPYLHHRIYFTTWLAYFGIAYIIGTQYQLVMKNFKKNWLALLVSLFVSTAIVLVYYKNGLTIPHSRRLDLIPYVTFMSLTVLTIGQVIPYNKMIDFFSNVSFGVFLYHFLIQEMLAKWMPLFSPKATIQVFLLFISSLLVTATLTFCISKLPGGKYVVGQVKSR